MHNVNGIKIDIAISGAMRSNPKDHSLHPEYDRIFISRRNNSMSYEKVVRLSNKKRSMKNRAVPLASNRSSEVSYSHSGHLRFSNE